jgi:hypothetical protein
MTLQLTQPQQICIIKRKIWHKALLYLIKILQLQPTKVHIDVPIALIRLKSGIIQKAHKTNRYKRKISYFVYGQDQYEKNV